MRPLPNRISILMANLLAASARADGPMRRLARPEQVDDRAWLATTLAILGGDEGVVQAADWFFKEPPERRRMPGVRADFLADLRRRRPERFWWIAARIVRDPRFDTLGPQSMRVLLDAMFERGPWPGVPDGERAAAFGIPEAQPDGLFAPLARWRAVARVAVRTTAGTSPMRPPAPTADRSAE